MSGKIREFFSF